MKRMFAWCALLALGAQAQASVPVRQVDTGAAFAVPGYRFGGEALVGVDGRLRVAPTAARLHRLAADRWMREQGEGTPQQWFDDAGRLLREDAGYLQYGERFVLPGAAGQPPLWQAFMIDAAGVRLGQGVVDALGQVRWPPMQDGDWRPLAVPDRVLWMPQAGPLRFFDMDARAVLAKDERAWHWVAGPFPGRHAYVFCAATGDAACQVLDEQHGVLFEAVIDALLPVADGGWWLRERDWWRRVDAQGRTLDTARYQQDGFHPRYQQYGGSAGSGDWPREVRRFATGSDRDRPERGWLLADGRFQALPAQHGGYRLDYCGGRWWIDDDDANAPPQAVTDAVATVLGRPDEAMRQAPPWRVRAADASRGAAVLDCQGQVVFDRPQVADIDVLDGGVLGTFAGEHAPRLWWEGTVAHTVPAGLAIDDDHLAPPLLLLWDPAAGQNRLYNGDLGRVVGRGFDAVVHMDARRVVFARDGQQGLMLADGSEPLPPRYLEILPWSEDRTWARRALEGGDEELTLLDADYAVLTRRRLVFSGVALETTWQGEVEDQAVARLNLGTMALADGPYFVQQWVDRQGQVLVSDVSCPAPGDDLLARGAGVLLGRDWRVDSAPRQPCRLPAALTPVLQGGDAMPAQKP